MQLSKKTLLNHHNSLTPQRLNLTPYTLRSVPSLTDDPPSEKIPSPIPSTATGLDPSLEKTLNARSLFHKPIQLFPPNPSPSASSLDSYKALSSNFMDLTSIRPTNPHLEIPTQKLQPKPFFAEILNTTTTSTFSNSPSILAKKHLTPNKHSRKSPFYTCPPKKSSLSPLESTQSPSPSTPSFPSSQVNKKKAKTF
jgi:hypothetical protein